MSKNVDKVSKTARESKFWNKQDLDRTRKEYLENVQTVEQWYRFLQNNNYPMALFASSSYPIDYREIDHPVNLEKFIYKNVAKVESLDFNSILEKIKKDTVGINSSNSKVCSTRVQNFNHELQFLQSMGFDKVGHVITPTAETYPELFELVKHFEFDFYVMQLRIQYPGTVQEAHTDALDCFWGNLLLTEQDSCQEIIKLPFDPVTKSPDGYYAIRLIMPLVDYEPGQVFGFEDEYWTNWKAGDVISFDWAHLMHYTANGSFVPRILLKITGITSDKNHWIFENINNDKTTKI